MQRLVDEIVEDIIFKRFLDARTDQLKRLGSSATPYLLWHLHSKQERRCKVAFYGLQYCWAQCAVEPVSRLLGDSDLEIRKMAAIVLAKGEGPRALARLCKAFIDNPNPEVATFALEYLEAEYPDVERTLKVLNDPHRRLGIIRYLPRYYTSACTPLTQQMLSDAIQKGHAERGALVIAALIVQGARTEVTRNCITALLCADDPLWREMAAEYFTWMGAKSDRAIVMAVVNHEIDPYAKASMCAAISVMTHRSQKFCEIIDDRTMFEPHWAYRGVDPDGAFVRECGRRLCRLAERFSMPAKIMESAITYPNAFAAEIALDLAPPIRNYFDPERKSYGRLMEDDAKGFADLIHVADDCGWFRDYQTVVAMAAGMVREVTHSATWGHLVVIEHELPQDYWRTAPGWLQLAWRRFTRTVFSTLTGFSGGPMICSLYGHLGPFIHVTPGQVVAKGDKIGSIGRSYTWENGGYAAHLHFAVHLGPFWQVHQPGTFVDINYQASRYAGEVVWSNPLETAARIECEQGQKIVYTSTSWVCGYICEERFETDNHGWVDPQRLLLE